MATVTSEVTVDTGEWVYIDSVGMPHTVKNGEKFSITIENTASAIKWNVLAEAPSLHTTEVATDDGYKLRFRPSATAGNVAHDLSIMALGDTTMSRDVPGEWRIECPVTGRIQIWKFAQFYTSNVDMNAAGTIGANTALTQCLLEDQFGNTMRMPSGLVAGITADTAS